MPTTYVNTKTSGVEDQPPDYFSHTRKEIIDLIPLNAKTILDVGCGEGNLCRAVKNRQAIEAHGVEITEPAAEIARNHLDLVWNETIESVITKLKDNYYDCIVLADILEHLIDPWSILSDLKPKLTANGKLVASIPNIQNWRIVSKLMGGRWDYTTDGILDRTHLRFFTHQTILELFWDAGFKVEKLSTTNNESTQLPEKQLRRLNLSTEAEINDSVAYQFCLLAEIPKIIIEPKVSIIIVNWNGKEDTIECLTSINQLDYTNYEVIVVDNGSTDNSVMAIQEAHPTINIIEAKKNTGFSGGNNIGIQIALESDSDYILLLNNDTIIAEDLLQNLTQAASLLPEGSVLGPNIYYFDNPDTLWFAGGEWIDEENRFGHIGHNQKDGKNYNTIKQVDFITGCALFSSVNTFKEVGLLDDDFFLTYEDTDWCYRALEKGYKCIVVPEAKLWHKVSVSFGGPTSPLVSYFMTRNKLLWAKKHCDIIGWRVIKQEARQLAQSIFLPPFVFTSANESIFKRIIWSFSSWRKNIRSNLSRNSNKAVLYGLRDFYFRRFGDSPSKIRALASSHILTKTDSTEQLDEKT